MILGLSPRALRKPCSGRDHHPRCCTVWPDDSGAEPGFIDGATDEFGYNVMQHPVPVPDLQATILHQLGTNHEQLVFKHQGRDEQLTDVAGEVIKNVLV
ncbi:MAG: DUF1501 domain-containing protein [Opitutaceae bacterium]|nr:DUF1501 domain-containing protein [Opitutaceae bacterium]